MAGNFLSNFGLGMQGADEAQQVQQNLENSRQRNAILGQAVQTGQMGLEDTARKYSDAAKRRSAVAEAGSVGAGYGAASKADLAAGNLSSAAEGESMKRAHALNAVLTLANDAQIGTPAVEAEKKFRNSGYGQDVVPGSLEFGSVPNQNDPKFAETKQMHPDWQPGDHLVKVMSTDGRPIIQNATAIIRQHAKQDVHTTHPGGSFLITGAGSTPQLVTAPAAEKYASTNKGVIFSTQNGQPGYVPPDDSWMLGEIPHGDQKVPILYNKKTAEAVILGPGGSQRKTEIHTDNAGNVFAIFGDKLFRINSATPGTPGTSGFMGFGEKPGTPGTPETMTEIPKPETPPIGGTQKSPLNGKWYAKKADGKYYPVISVSDQQTPQEVKAQPVPIPETVMPKQETIVPKPQPKAPTQSIPTVTHNAAELNVMMKNAQKGYQPAIEYLKERVDSGELGRGDKMRVIDILRARGVPGYASGGKVQRYGL